MNKNIIIISHRRSGTHLTIDSIRNNFPDYKDSKLIVLENLTKNNREQIDFVKNFHQRTMIVKTHFLPDLKLYTKDEKLLHSLEELFNNSHLIYVYRNGLDVMVSLYEYIKKFDDQVREMKFDEFLKTGNNFDPGTERLNRMQFWRHHIESWQNSRFADRILWVRYEDLNLEYEQTLHTIATHFGLQIARNIKDIRLQSYKTHNRRLRKLLNLLRGIKTTSVSARKGTVGDYKNYFSTQSLQKFIELNKDLLLRLGYNIE